jgi:hypothetical protein
MTGRPATLRRPGLIALGAAVLGVAGFLLGACGGGEQRAIATASGPPGTRPTLTATRPTETVVPTVPAVPCVPTRTVPTRPSRTDTEVTTTAVSPIDTGEVTTEPEPEPPPPEPPPPPTITVVETETVAPEPAPPATTSAETTPAETVAPTPTSETDDGAWGWVALAGASLVALVLGLVLRRRHRADATAWSARIDDLERRSLVALDDVVAQGSVVTGRIQALAAEARSLERHAPDDSSRAAAARLRAGLNELAAALENDRVLRLATPPPGEEQLAYSTALIREQAARLQGLVRPPTPDDSWPTP